MSDKEIAALSGAHLSGTRFVYVAAEGAHAGTDRSLLESNAWCAPSSDPNVLTQSLAIMRFSQVQHGADWNDASGIDLRVRHVVVALDVVEIDGVCDAWLLI
jgi:hypothetical protein